MKAMHDKPLIARILAAVEINDLEKFAEAARPRPGVDSRRGGKSFDCSTPFESHKTLGVPLDATFLRRPHLRAHEVLPPGS